MGIGEVYNQPAIEQLALTDLDLAAADVGLAGSPTRVASLEKIKRSRRCLMLEGEVQQQVGALMDRLTQAGLIE